MSLEEILQKQMISNNKNKMLELQSKVNTMKERNPKRRRQCDFVVLISPSLSLSLLSSSEFSFNLNLNSPNASVLSLADLLADCRFDSDLQLIESRPRRSPNCLRKTTRYTFCTKLSQKPRSLSSKYNLDQTMATSISK